MEARVSALEQRKGSKAEGEGVAPTADPTEAGTGMGSASATEAESEARGLAMEPEAEESERERFAPEVPELTGEEQATGCLNGMGSLETGTRNSHSWATMCMLQHQSKQSC